MCRTHSWTWSSRNMTASRLFIRYSEWLIKHCRSGTPRRKPRQQKRSIENRVSASRILHRAIITQHKNFYYYLYACKTVVFIIIYSSIELTLVFDRTDFWFRSNWLLVSIELTCYPCDCFELFFYYLKKITSMLAYREWYAARTNQIV